MITLKQHRRWLRSVVGPYGAYRKNTVTDRPYRVGAWDGATDGHMMLWLVPRGTTKACPAPGKFRGVWRQAPTVTRATTAQALKAASRRNGMIGIGRCVVDASLLRRAVLCAPPGPVKVGHSKEMITLVGKGWRVVLMANLSEPERRLETEAL